MRVAGRMWTRDAGTNSKGIFNAVTCNNKKHTWIEGKSWETKEWKTWIQKTHTPWERTQQQTKGDSDNKYTSGNKERRISHEIQREQIRHNRKGEVTLSTMHKRKRDCQNKTGNGGTESIFNKTKGRNKMHKTTKTSNNNRRLKPAYNPFTTTDV